MQGPTFSLGTLDSVILIAYLVGVMALGLYLSRKGGGADDYFLAGRAMIWPFIGLSLFASNISSQTLVGLAGDAYATGISVYAYEWMAAIVLVIFAFWFLPVFWRTQVFTMPEYLGRRYDQRARTYFVWLTLFLNIVVDTAAALYAGALVLQLVFPGIPLWLSIAFLAVFAGIYTMAGGLAAVIYTDAIQAILLLVGSIIITLVALDQVGGWSAVLAAVPEEKLSLVRPLNDAGVPWLGLLSGVPLLGFYYWATNQTIVQRTLASKSIEHGRWGAVFAGLLKVIPLFIMVLPGSMAILLYPDLDTPNLVYPRMMFDLLPAGLLGLTLAGFIAAIMSAIDSALNSASTLVTMDIVKPRYPALDDKRLVMIGRIAMAMFMVFAMIWAPQVGRFDSLFQYLQQMLSYLVPPIVALFVTGILWRRANARGAIFGIAVGLGAGAALFILNVALSVISLHFLYVAPIIFVLSLAAIYAGSLTAPAPDPQVSADYCYNPKVDKPAPIGRENRWRNFRFQAGGLFLTVAIMLAFFW